MIVLCYDGSGSAKHAITTAHGIVGQSPALLLHVWEPPANYLGPDPFGGIETWSGPQIVELEAMALERANRTVEYGVELARDAGFTVKTIPASAPQHADLTLRTLSFESNQPLPALDALLRQAGLAVPLLDNSPAVLYKIEREILDTHMIIPLLYLPRAFAVSGRLRDLRLSADGSPLLANASLEDAP